MKKDKYLIFKSDDWEEVPHEDLWEDGELNFKQVDQKILEGIHITGEYLLIRRKENE